MAFAGFRSIFNGSLPARSLSLRSGRSALWAGAGLAVGLAGLANPAQAFVQINVIGTGQNNPASATPSTTLDANWKVASLPTGVTNTNTATVGNRAYVVYQTPLVGGRCPWIGGGSATATPPCKQTGYQYGGNTSYWISPSSDALALRSATEDDAGSWYSYVLEQTVNVPTTGTYDFAFSGTADNFLSVFIGGTPTDSGTSQLPTVTGGTQIGFETVGLGRLFTYTGTASLAAGTTKVYLVVKDKGSYTGVIISEETKLVPGPLPLLGAGAAFGWSRRLRRRARGVQQV